MGDILLFDARTKTCETLISNKAVPVKQNVEQLVDELGEEQSETPEQKEEQQLKVSSAANQVGLAGQNIFVSLVNANNEEGKTCPMVIGYQRGAAKLFEIRNFIRDTSDY